MVNFKVFNKKEKVEEAKNVYFKLINNDGDIRLVACDANGAIVKRGMILKITSKGKLYLYSEINSSLGLDLDEEGEILLE